MYEVKYLFRCHILEKERKDIDNNMLLNIFHDTVLYLISFIIVSVSFQISVVCSSKVIKFIYCHTLSLENSVTVACRLL